MRRVGWFCLGWVAVGVGILGVIVPGLPAVGCFVGAAACFSKSHPRCEQWILGLPTIGPMVRDHRAGLGMPRRAKVIAIITMSTACLISSIVVGSIPLAAVIVVTGAAGVLYIAYRVPTRATTPPPPVEPPTAPPVEPPTAPTPSASSSAS